VRAKWALGWLLWLKEILNSRAIGIQKIQSDPSREGHGPGARTRFSLLVPGARCATESPDPNSAGL